MQKMAPENNNNWLSFSLSSMEMLNNNSSVPASNSSADDSHNHFYSFADNFYATGWANQKTHAMYAAESDNMKDQTIINSSAAAFYSGYMNQQPPPKLEDFFAGAGGGVGGGDSTETQDSSSLTQLYAPQTTYFCGGEQQQQQQQDLNNFNRFQAYSANSGSEVDDSGFAVESGNELVAYSHPLQSNNGLSLGGNHNNNNGVSVNDVISCAAAGNNNNNESNKTTAIVPVETCKKIADTFGQRTSIYRGVTRHRWTGRYEAHLWDNSCRREGQARKGRQVYLGGYDKEDKAARSYDLAALKYWGTSATTNFPMSNYSKEMEEMKHVTKQEFIASLRRKSSGFSRGASIYRGVTRHHQQGRWQARIGRVAGNKDLYLGTFATEEEAAEAYDIAAIKFRGINAVTNFEMNRYDVEAISKSPLPIGGAAKRLKISLEGEEKLPFSGVLQTPCTSNSSSISFSSIQPSTIPCGIPYDHNTAPYYHQSLFHHLNHQNATDASVSLPMTLMPSSGGEYFIWPQQNY